MSAKGSTLFTVGTLLRHAQDAGAPVRLLVQGTWLDGRIVGADGLGVVLDDGNTQQVLVRSRPARSAADWSTPVSGLSRRLVAGTSKSCPTLVRAVVRRPRPALRSPAPTRCG